MTLIYSLGYLESTPVIVAAKIKEEMTKLMIDGKDGADGLYVGYDG